MVSWPSIRSRPDHPDVVDDEDVVDAGERLAAVAARSRGRPWPDRRRSATRPAWPRASAVLRRSASCRASSASVLLPAVLFEHALPALVLAGQRPDSSRPPSPIRCGHGPTRRASSAAASRRRCTTAGARCRSGGGCAPARGTAAAPAAAAPAPRPRRRGSRWRQRGQRAAGASEAASPDALAGRAFQLPVGPVSSQPDLRLPSPGVCLVTAGEQAEPQERSRLHRQNRVISELRRGMPDASACASPVAGLDPRRRSKWVAFSVGRSGSGACWRSAPHLRRRRCT